MKRLGILIAIISLFMCLPVWAANTVVKGAGFIYVKLDGSTSFSWSTATFTGADNYGMKVSAVFPGGLPLKAIKVANSAAAGSIIIRDKSTSGPIITQLTSIDGGVLKEYILTDKSYTPYILNSEQTTPTNAQIWFEF